MRVNTNMLEAQGARLIKTISDQVINTGRFISQETSFFPSFEVFNPPPQFEKRTEALWADVFDVCDGRSREGSMDLALGAFLRTTGTCWHSSGWHLSREAAEFRGETMVWGRRELAAPSLHPDMARCLRPLVGNNRLKKKKQIYRPLPRKKFKNKNNQEQYN